jgi:hypothetical protein
MIDIRTWTRKQFVCDCIVVLPMKKMHGSGYRLMDFVAIKDGKPLCKLSGCSDVIHIDGIGGSGYRYDRLNPTQRYFDLTKQKAWSIDCLAKSGLLRMWASYNDLICGPSLSSFEIWAVREEVKKEE